jgi:hypothetical protein
MEQVESQHQIVARNSDNVTPPPKLFRGSANAVFPRTSPVCQNGGLFFSQDSVFLPKGLIFFLQLIEVVCYHSDTLLLSDLFDKQDKLLVYKARRHTQSLALQWR